MQPTIRLIKFGGPWCSHCVAMDKSRVLEQFAAVTPEVVVKRHDIDDDSAIDPLADAYDAMSMPTLVFEEITTGRELIRWEGGLNLTKLRELFADAKAVLAGEPVKNKRQAKQSATYQPRTGGYDDVQARVESPEPEPEPEPDPDLEDEGQ